MNLSSFVTQADAPLVSSAEFAANTIGAAPGIFGLTAGGASAINTASALLSTRYDEYLAAKSAFDSAVKAKASARDNFANVFTTYLQQSYANPAVTDAALASIGLDSRPSRTVRPVRQPLELVVTPSTNGYIAAKWKRNQNTTATTFVLEQLSADNQWEVIWVGTRIRVELTGFTPGVRETFRVYATKADQNSAPSNTYTIYENGGNGEIQLAA
ncbi:MAG: fibronectin type III domain-containing protein [Chthonomonas sp.]|nr:fibronectin type III domain-containing protein [Chthonomonas sp.]